MSIDWFTVGAQIINFLILVWLMKRFLYKPILTAIDTRETKVAAELADADAKKAKAEKEQDEFRKKNEDFDRQHAEQLSKMKDEVKTEREKLLDEARKEADSMSAKRQELLRNDADNLNKSISLRTQQEVFSIARKALADLGTANLEESMCDVFIRRLSELNGKAKDVLSGALKTATEPALLRSAFDLPKEQHVAIQNALNEIFNAEIHLKYETVPELIGGIEFSSNGYKVAWTLADYLETMEKSIGELIETKDKTEDMAETKSQEAAPEKGADEHGK